MYDLVTVGEVLLRLAVPSPGRIETARQLDVQIGGAEANVAAACARLGARVAWLSALPANEWGERARRELTGHGVDCSYVRMTEAARLGLYFLEYGVPPRPISVLYDRRDSAFARLRPDELDWTPVRQARLVHVSGVTAGLGELSRAVVRRTLAEARVLSYDVNYRARLWSGDEARAFLDEVLPQVHYLFVGEEEARVLGFTGRAEGIVTALAQRAPDAIIAVMRGADGSLVKVGDKLYAPSRRPVVQVVDPIGAGDAFVAGYLWATLTDRTPESAVDIADAVAALKCSTWGDVALVTRSDIDNVLGGRLGVQR
jgi:2-dehydro-3-deoxygluconokinase